MPKLAMAENCKSKRVYSSALLFAINSATKAKTTTVVPTQETTAAVKGPARTVETIDPLKKKQCFVALQRLMEHRDGWVFMNGKGFAEDCNLSSKSLMDFETVKQKLDKGTQTLISSLVISESCFAMSCCTILPTMKFAKFMRN